MTEQESFVTELISARRGGVVVIDRDGTILLNLQPGRPAQLESANALTTFAPFSRITWNEDGTVACEPRPGWADPYDKFAPWKVIYLNVDGKEIEEKVVAGYHLFLMKGIPVPIFVSARAEEAKYARVKLVHGEKDQHSERWPGYLIRSTVLVEVNEERPEKELALVMADRERLLEKEQGAE
jgi:hypothetical protein